MKNELIKIEGQKGLTLTGWELGKLTESKWIDAGRILVSLDQARQWWLGDWWNACKWGDGKEACERISINYDTARICGQVAKTFKKERRRSFLGFNHHREVKSIEDEAMQDKLLDWAIAENASVKKLRAKVQEYLAMADWSEPEKARRFDVEAGKAVVANVGEYEVEGEEEKQSDANLINWAKSNGLYVFVGRGKFDLGWGNPYELDKDGDRHAVCFAHERYFVLKKGLHKKMDRLFGKVLGCYCYPEQCHGDHLARIANLLTLESVDDWTVSVNEIISGEQF